jgi:phosphate transport system permease protein
MTNLASPPPPTVEEPEDVPLTLEVRHEGADRAFRLVLVASGALVLALLLAIVAFLIIKGGPAAGRAGFHFFSSQTWGPDNNHFGVAPLLLGSIAIAVVSLVVAVPVSLGTALMINEYAPPRLRKWLTSVVDLLATIPSIVYGFWGLAVISGWQSGPAGWLGHYFGFIPFFRTPSTGSYIKSIFATGLICALTIIPIITSVSREVMAQAPREACEAALGLGGTRWGMVTDVILPFARNGIVGAVMLGFGRGLGETMIPVLVLSSAKKVTPAILGPNGLGSVAAEIARLFPDGSVIEKSGLILAGLALFAVTLGVNIMARMIVQRTEVSVR